MTVEKARTLFKRLSTKDDFLKEVPRYPNLWFLVGVDVPLHTLLGESDEGADFQDLKWEGTGKLEHLVMTGSTS